MTSSVIGRLHALFAARRRVRVLGYHLSDMLPEPAAVLDVGCGDGLIDRILLERRPDLSLQGVDVLVRPQAYVPVTRFDGEALPFADNSFDTVMFVDVLHHTADPMILIKEARRVARKSIIIKDHTCDSRAAAGILRVMDWVGNAPHGVVLTYNYWSERRWRDVFERLDLTVSEYRSDLGLYPPGTRWMLERSLHFVARLEVGALSNSRGP